jgi:hypothetical protein
MRRGVRNTRSLIVTSPYVSSPKEKGACSHFFPLFFVCLKDQKHLVNYTSPRTGWSFSLTYPKDENGQSQPTEIHQPMDWLGIDPNLT